MITQASWTKPNYLPTRSHTILQSFTSFGNGGATLKTKRHQIIGSLRADSGNSTAFFIRWLTENDMTSDEFEDDAKQCKLGKISGARLFAIWDGVLASDQLTDEGNSFTRHYYTERPGGYFDDYRKALMEVSHPCIMCRTQRETIRSLNHASIEGI